MDAVPKTDFDWRIRVEVQWLNRAANIGVARAYVEAEGYRQHRYSIYLRDRAAFLDIVADVLREHAERMEVSP